MDITQAIDLEEYFQKGKTLEGTFGSNQLLRLVEIVNGPTDSINWALQFSLDNDKRNVINCSITACLNAICQRCGDEMVLPITVNSTLCAVAKDDLVKKMPKKYEPFVTYNEPVVLMELIEEELLLAIPMIPRHDEENCHANLSKDLIN